MKNLGVLRSKRSACMRGGEEKEGEKKKRKPLPRGREKFAYYRTTREESEKNKERR